MRYPSLTQEECFDLLKRGFILVNEHSFTVKLIKGKQVCSNKARARRGKYKYNFDYPTWRICGRISFWNRVGNFIAKILYPKQYKYNTTPKGV